MQSFSLGCFEMNCKELKASLQDCATLQKQLNHERYDLGVRIMGYEEERARFEEEREEWKEELDRNKQEILEQNDMLAVLSQSLAGLMASDVSQYRGIVI